MSYKRTFAALLLVSITVLGALGAAGTRIDFVGGTTGTTDNAVLRADGTGGLRAQSSTVTIDDSGNIACPNSATLTLKESGGTSNVIAATGSGGITFARSGSVGTWIYPGDGRVQMRNDGYFGWSSGTNPVTGGDTGLTRASAGNVNITNTGGTTYCTLGAAGFAGQQTKALTETTATAFVQIAVASGTHVGGTIHYTLVANDGTDYQTRSGSFNFALVNKAGAETANLGTVSAEAAAITTGTLTVSFDTDTSPTNAVNIRANATSSLTQTTLTIRYWVEIEGSAVTVTPQ